MALRESLSLYNLPRNQPFSLGVKGATLALMSGYNFNPKSHYVYVGVKFS